MMRFTYLTTLITLPLALVSSTSSPSTPSATLARSGPLAIVEIRQTLYSYALAIDSKNYTALANVFTPDARADFKIFPVTYGLPAIVARVSKALEGLITQHSLTTQVITVKNETDASAVTYLQANFFGQKNLTGQVYTDYGKYVDDLTFDENVGWRVRNKTLVILALVGNPAIVKAE